MCVENIVRSYEAYLEAGGRDLEALTRHKSKLNCRRRTDSKFPADAGFICFRDSFQGLEDKPLYLYYKH